MKKTKCCGGGESIPPLFFFVVVLNSVPCVSPPFFPPYFVFPVPVPVCFVRLDSSYGFFFGWYNAMRGHLHSANTEPTPLLRSAKPEYRLFLFSTRFCFFFLFRLRHDLSNCVPFLYSFFLLFAREKRDFFVISSGWLTLYVSQSGELEVSASITTISFFLLLSFPKPNTNGISGRKLKYHPKSITPLSLSLSLSLPLKISWPNI